MRGAAWIRWVAFGQWLAPIVPLAVYVIADRFWILPAVVVLTCSALLLCIAGWWFAWRRAAPISQKLYERWLRGLAVSATAPKRLALTTNPWWLLAYLEQRITLAPESGPEEPTLVKAARKDSSTQDPGAVLDEWLEWWPKRRFELTLPVPPPSTDPHPFIKGHARRLFLAGVAARPRIVSKQLWLTLAILGPFVASNLVLVQMHRFRKAAALDELELVAAGLGDSLLVEETPPAPPTRTCQQETAPASWRPFRWAQAKPSPQTAAPNVVVRIRATRIEPTARAKALAGPPAGQPAGTPDNTPIEPPREKHVEEIATEFADARYRHSPTSPDALRMRALAITVANALRRQQAECDDLQAAIVGPRGDASRWMAKRLRASVAADSWWGMVQLVSLQIFFIVCLPLLLLAGTLGAEQRTRARGQDIVATSSRTRDRKLVARASRPGWLLARFAFACLLGFGTLYVLAPLGLKASYLAEVNEHLAVPGHTSHFLWATHFGDAPLVVVGFVGYLLYAFAVTIQAYLADDLDDRLFLSLLGRGLVVVLLATALATTPIDGTVNRLLVFVAGIVPMRAIEALAARVQVAIDPELKGHTGGFEGLPHLSIHMVAALRRAGIESTHQLAMMAPAEIAREVRIDPPLLLARLIDRAILFEAAGKALFDDLEKAGITTATQVVSLDEGDLKKLEGELALRSKVETLRDSLTLTTTRGESALLRKREVSARLGALSTWIEAAQLRSANGRPGDAAPATGEVAAPATGEVAAPATGEASATESADVEPSPPADRPPPPVSSGEGPA